MFPVIKTELIEAGGLTFEVDTCGDPDSSMLILLLHGFPESSYAWHNQMPQLAELGCKCWAPNQRGYGASVSPNSVAGYDIDHLVADVGYLIDAAKCDSVILVGHDWGGVVAWEAVRRKVRPIESLVVMNCPHPEKMRKGMRRWRQMRRSWYMLFFQLPFVPELLFTCFEGRVIDSIMRSGAVHKERFPPSLTQVYRDNLLKPGTATATINWYRAMARRRFSHYDNREDVAKIQTPTLMIWGEQDRVLGVELSQGMDELMDDVTVRYIEDASHWVHEDAPQRCNAMLEAWLGGRVVPGTPEPTRRVA